MRPYDAHDAHVQARQALIRRVFARGNEWGVWWLKQWNNHTYWTSARWEQRERACFAAIEAALATYQWSLPTDGFYGHYCDPDRYGEPKRAPKDIPASVLHQLMCEAGLLLRNRHVACKKEKP